MDEDQNQLLKQKIKRKLLGGPRDMANKAVDLCRQIKREIPTVVMPIRLFR